MGTREEAVRGMLIKGFSGKIRPHQLEGGKCKECQEPVFVEVHENVKTVMDRVMYVHYGCSHE